MFFSRQATRVHERALVFVNTPAGNIDSIHSLGRSDYFLTAYGPTSGLP
jgi:hypothetical protein